MNVRCLRDGEQDAMLDLVGLWPAQDDWPMRDLLGRYVEADPGFDVRDVWVAEEGGAPLSCVQIFPRKLTVRGKSVPIGGIGSVFTHPEHRKGGLSSAVMRAAMEDMRSRGMELGLLFAGPVPFYEALGWHSWKMERPLLRAPADTDPGASESAAVFDPARDLAEVQSLHASYSRMREGTCVRDPAGWWTNLRNAGNPDEEFLVARAGRHVVAYLRAVCLSRFLVMMEWGCERGAVDALAGLFVAALTARGDDPLAPPARPSAEFRSVASAPPILDPALAQALAARGIETVPTEDRGSMFWVARSEALAHRYGEPYRPRGAGDLEPEGERAARLLRRILPPARFAFWPADRF